MAEGFKSDIPPAINQTAKKYIRGMMKGKRRWSKLYGKRDKEVMHKTANKMALKDNLKVMYYKDFINLVEGNPIAIESGYGSVITDVDGNDYIDFKCFL